MSDDGHQRGRYRGPVNIASLDLNLLVSLDALLQERSVTRAAARMGLSQPRSRPRSAGCAGTSATTC